jgi:hypothetical protein
MASKSPAAMEVTGARSAGLRLRYQAKRRRLKSSTSDRMLSNYVRMKYHRIPRQPFWAAILKEDI